MRSALLAAVAALTLSTAGLTGTAGADPLDGNCDFEPEGPCEIWLFVCTTVHGVVPTVPLPCGGDDVATIGAAAIR